MDLRVSVVLLFFFLTGGYSLRCYSCEPDSKGYCDAKEEPCADGFSKCKSRTEEKLVGSANMSVTTKGCASQCDPDAQLAERTMSICCDADLCNAADGVYKGSFLLLFSPLLFYFLFQ